MWVTLCFLHSFKYKWRLLSLGLSMIKNLTEPHSIKLGLLIGSVAMDVIVFKVSSIKVSGDESRLSPK